MADPILGLLIASYTIESRSALLVFESPFNPGVWEEELLKEPDGNSKLILVVWGVSETLYFKPKSFL